MHQAAAASLLCLSWTTLLGSTAGCGSDGDDGFVAVQFEARFGAEVARCGTTYSGIGMSSDTVSLKDLRFYVSNVRLLAADGAEEPLVLTTDSAFQTEDVALVDLEDGTGGCATMGDARLHTEVAGTVTPDFEATGLAFDLAVPFALNHQDLTASAAPLDIAPMFWAWGIGRKFMRIDLDRGGESWNVHLGSTMCSMDPMVPPTVECMRPNRAAVTIGDFDPRDGLVVLDLAAMLATSDLQVNTDMTAFGCQSFPGDPECGAVYSAFAMSYDDGGCVGGCAGQVVFSGE